METFDEAIIADNILLTKDINILTIWVLSNYPENEWTELKKRNAKIKVFKGPFR